MNLGVALILLQKELLDIIRDRRTLISLILAPMLVGPGTMYAMSYFIRQSETQARVQRFTVGLREDTILPGLSESLAGAGLEVRSVPAPREAVESRSVTFGIEVTGAQQKPVIRFFSDNSDMTASMARSRVNAVLDTLERNRIRAELARHNVPEAILQPFSRESVNIAKPRKMTGAFVGRVMGFLLLIFLFNGAMYAAVDTTAGEKERRTIEVLLSSAAGRTEIVTAKIATALTTAFGTTALTMLSYGIAFTSMDRRGAGPPGISFPTDVLSLTLLALLILPVGVLAASACIAAAAPARSNREAMSYLTPGLFVVISLGLVSFLPGLETSNWLAMLPFANFAQSLREVLSGELSWTRYGLTFASNLIYASVAAAFAVHRFRSESILFRT